MNERDLIIWCAGFFDGEGCVSIGKSQYSRKRKNGTVKTFWCYSLMIVLAQKTKAPLERFRSVFGGYLWSFEAKGITYWRLTLNAAKAAATLEAMLPYLLVKRPVAEVAIRFHAQMTEWNKQYGRTGYPEEIAAARDIFYMQARELNAKNRTNNRAPKYVGPRHTDNRGTTLVQ